MELRSLAKLIISALAVVGAVASILALYPVLFSKAPSLRAEVIACVYAVPPGIEEEFRKGKQLVSEASLRNDVKFSTPSLPRDLVKENFGQQLEQQLRESVISSIALSLGLRMKDSLPSTYQLMRGFWVGKIKNNGDAVATSIIFKIPDANYFCLQHEGEPASCKEASEVLQIGALQPQESVSIQVWSTSQPTYYTSNDVRLTFSQGIGSVSISAPASSFWLWMDRNWGIWWFPVSSTLLLALALVGYFLDSRKRPASPK